MTEPDPVLNRIEAAVLDVFGVPARFDACALPGARRLPLGREPSAIFLRCDDLGLLATIRRFVVRELDQQHRHARTERNLENLKAKTSRLLPASPTGRSAIEAWSLEEADLPLLERFDRWAVAVNREVARRQGLDEGDVTTTLRVLERAQERSIAVGRGELFGHRVGEVSVIVRARAPLEVVDRELITLQATWIQRMLEEQRNLRKLVDLREELAHNNEALESALEVARGAAAARATFLAHMSHEIRTPLNGIVGVAQLLEDSDLSEAQRELVGVQLESARWLREVIDAVLDLSKIEAGAMQLERAPFDVYELVFAAERGMRAQVDERGLLLEVHIDEAVPRYVDGDATRIRQCLLNLLSNAIKFTLRGTIRLGLDAAPNGVVRFTVDDEGVGVPEAQREAIFEPFEQATANPNPAYGGTGLGLPLVRRFARLHAGEAGVQPRPAGGSRFWFTASLPAVDTARLPETSPRPAPGIRLRVLVAEDHPVNQMVARRMLEQRGHEVDVVGDGAEAVARIEDGQVYDVILMDRMMPRMDGLEATRRIRALTAQERRLPILAVTASVTAEERASCLASGMDRVIAKPLRRHDLDEALGEVLAHRPRA